MIVNDPYASTITQVLVLVFAVVCSLLLVLWGIMRDAAISYGSFAVIDFLNRHFLFVSIHQPQNCEPTCKQEGWDGESAATVRQGPATYHAPPLRTQG